MAINSDADICNMALGHLGNYGTVSSIETPETDIERTFALWFGVSRETLLKLVMPNFSLARIRSARITDYEADDTEGYAYAYQKPNDMLKLLGIGSADIKDNSYSVEGNKILTDELYDTGAYLRYIKNEIDVSKWSAEFKDLCALYLAAKCCLPITQDAVKQQAINQQLQSAMMTVSSINAQENRPVIRNTSRFKQARYSGFVSEDIKK